MFAIVEAANQSTVDRILLSKIIIVDLQSIKEDYPEKMHDMDQVLNYNESIVPET